VYNHRQLGSPVPGLGPAIARFIAEAEQALEREPGPLAFWTAGTSHVQASLGASQVDGPLAVRGRLDAGELPLWVVAGHRPNEPRRLEDWLARLAARRGTGGTAWAAEPVVRSPRFPWTDMLPEQLTLFRVTRADRQDLRRNSTVPADDSDNDH
jgi:hypothetical protein